MTTMQALSHSELAAQQLNGTRGFLLSLIETLSDEQLTAQAGGAGNHALWIMGHLAWTEDFFVSAFRHAPGCLPSGHAEQFGFGTAPSNDASSYPDREELLRRLNVARDQTVEWVESLQGDAAWQPSPKHVAPITPNAISAAFTLAQHEFLHAGQITAIRASLGMKPLYS